MFVILYQQTGGKPKCTIFICQGLVYVVFDLDLKQSHVAVSKSYIPDKQCFLRILFTKKNCFFPCVVKTKAIGAQHHDDIVHSHEVFWTLKVTGHNIPVRKFNFLLLLLNMETRSNHYF